MLTCASFVQQAFININITQLRKPMTLQCDDQLIGYGKTVTGL